MIDEKRLLELACRQDFAPEETTVMAREILELRAWAAGVRALGYRSRPPPPEGTPENKPYSPRVPK